VILLFESKRSNCIDGRVWVKYWRLLLLSAHVHLCND
jgi:hypothetical protein